MNSLKCNQSTASTTFISSSSTTYNHALNTSKPKSNNDFVEDQLTGFQSKKFEPTPSDEFIDCIELLNKAEKKVQNRQNSPKVSPKTSPENGTKARPAVSSLGLPEKYFRAVNILDNAACETAQVCRDLDGHQVVLTKSLLASLDAANTVNHLISSECSSSSSSSSGNSLSANITASSAASSSSFQSYSNPTGNNFISHGNNC